MKTAHKIWPTLSRLAQADIAFYILPLVMLYLVAGTLAQAPMGLYAAQKMFFGSFILWVGPLPLPGFYIVTALLTLSLLIKFIFFSDWNLKKSGINLTHLGVLVLLAGGLATATTAREGYIALGEGEVSPYVYDYLKRDLFIFKGEHLAQSIPFESLHANNFHPPFDLKILETCENCAIEKQENPTPAMKGMARFMMLKPKTPEKEPEENITGTTLQIGKDTYIAFEGMPKPILYKGYKIIMGREQRKLPFSIKLQNFTKDSYPGTDKARAYSSDIIVKDGKLEWPAKISMNEPLRYKGYTFYQSSFEQTKESEISILSVVENKGRLFPYIGTFLMAAGLILHLFLMTKERKK
jgi:hypothetical protein